MGAYDYMDEAEAQALEARFDEIIAQHRRTGEHLWIALVAFRIEHPELNGPLVLDKRNAMTSAQIGCYLCAEPWSPRLRRRRCTGSRLGPGR
jgi:hypothetical protein